MRARAHRTMPIKAIFFDVGYTLIDETRKWSEWADWLRVPRERFHATLHDVIARGEHHTRVFEILVPGFDLVKERAKRSATGNPDIFDASDLYPDALPCLRELRRRGYLIGLAGNQPEAAEAALRAMGMPADIIASSARWGVEKPSPAFFRKVVEAASCPAGQIAYVGDRVDNDVLPARAAGMFAIFLNRGPWGRIHSTWPEAARAHLALDALAGLPQALNGLT
jgi:FMN phosphatase YigB (HAD superfamily)